MNDWRAYYKEHLMTAKEAVLKMPKDARIATSHAAAEPRFVLDTMTENREHFCGATVFSVILMGETSYCAPCCEGHIRYTTMFVSAGSRVAVKENRADYIPCFYNDVPSYITNYMKPNVSVISVSPPDEHGYCSFGLTCDYQRAAINSADLVIAQVNNRLPYVMGDNFVHVTELDCIVEAHESLPILGKGKIGDAEKAIGINCGSLISDGDTLQLGIGGIPDAVLMTLGEKHDLGIHSEMFSDGVVELINAGIVNNRKKTLHNGVSVATFLMGSEKLYEYVNNNPSVGMYPVDYTNNPYIAAKNDNLMAINSCLQVDLTGQVTAESIGTRQFSGVGGQVDFVRAATMSRGGKAIIAIPSTAAKGTISRIAPMLDLGSGVTTDRNEVDYIVTEYGIASLKGKTINQRAEALIKIAHPDFRESLKKDFLKRY